MVTHSSGVVELNMIGLNPLKFTVVESPSYVVNIFELRIYKPSVDRLNRNIVVTGGRPVEQEHCSYER